MTIQVRVISAGALAQLRGLEAAAAKTTTASRGMNRSLGLGFPMLSKWGNQVQWAGRQLRYNFTIPLGIAAIADTKVARDNEGGMSRITEVYGDGSKEMRQYAKVEIPALGRAME